MIDGGDCREIRGINEWQRKPHNSAQTSFSAALSTTDTIRLEPGSNPGRRGGKPATNGLSYGTTTRSRIQHLSLRAISQRAHKHKAFRMTGSVLHAYSNLTKKYVEFLQEASNLIQSFSLLASCCFLISIN
jgi:hypothetical protein